MEHLLAKRDKLKGKVETVMGGKVLELPSDRLREKIAAISDIETLRKLHKLAARAGSLEEFEKDICDIS